MYITRNKEYVRECVLHEVMLEQICVVHCSYVLQMRTIANCKSYESQTIDTNVYIWYV